MEVLITGASGFIGYNLQKYFNELQIPYETLSLRNTVNELSIPDNIKAVVHLAGKAHDLKNVSDDSEYYRINTSLTKSVYEAFKKSNADVFIYLSSVKAVADSPDNIIDENTVPNPLTVYGKSKLAAEQYLVNNQVPNKRLYILRPCMVHGPNNKGNLNLLYTIIKSGMPYPLGGFSNQRSYLSVENLCYVINECLTNSVIPTGTYMVADDEPLSTNDVVKLIGTSLNKNAKIVAFPIWFIKWLAMVGDFIKLPLTTERLQKLTESYVVSNQKITTAIGKKLPISSRDGLKITFNSFKN